MQLHCPGKSWPILAAAAHTMSSCPETPNGMYWTASAQLYISPCQRNHTVSIRLSGDAVKPAIYGAACHGLGATSVHGLLIRHMAIWTQLYICRVKSCKCLLVCLHTAAADICCGPLAASCSSTLLLTHHSGPVQHPCFTGMASIQSLPDSAVVQHSMICHCYCCDPAPGGMLQPA